MASKYWKTMNNKKGTTLVEVIAAVIILAIVVVAVLTTIGFSQRTVISGSSEGNAAAQAQSIADALISELHSKAVLEVQKETSVGGVTVAYVESGSFPDATKDKQFTIVSVTDNATNVQGYTIKTAVYFTDSTGRKCVQMTAFAVGGGS